MLPSRDELRAAVRSLRRHPAFVAMSVGSLGLGIGLTVTMLGLVDAFIQPTFPVKDADRLYRVHWYAPPKSRALRPEELTAALRDVPQVAEFVTQAQGPYYGSMVEARGATLTRARVAHVPPRFFEFFDGPPAAGRYFTSADSTAEQEGAAVISEKLWRRLYPEAKPFAPFAIHAEGRSLVVIGVAPRKMEWLAGQSELFLPSAELSLGIQQWVRAAEGASPAEFNRAMQQLASRLSGLVGVPRADARFRIFKLTEPSGEVAGIALGLSGAALAVLLIACANIANLQLARALSRLRDLGVRVAVGASRADIMRLLLTESTLLAIAGGGLGIILSVWGRMLLSAFVPAEAQEFGIIEPQFTWRVLVAAIVVTGIAAIAFGLLPALRVSRLDVAEIMKSGTGTGMTRSARRQYSALVAVEVAGALGLFICAAMLGGSLSKLDTVDFGYDIRDRYWVSPTTALKRRDSTDLTATIAKATAVTASLRSVPAIQAATWDLLVAFDSGAITVDDPNPLTATARVTDLAGPLLVDANYLRTKGIAVRGSDFPVDGDGTSPAVIIDSVAAATYFPGRDPIGHMIKLGHGRSRSPWYRIIGVARHVRGGVSYSLDASLTGAQVYVNDRAFGTRPGQSFIRRGARTPGFLVRTKLGGSGLVTVIRDGVERHGYPRVLVGSMEEASGLVALRRTQGFLVALFSAFGFAGLGLAMIGIYGVVSHSVRERTREMGVRVALGARPFQLAGLVLREGNLPLFAGLALGLLAGRYAEDLMSYFIVDFYGVDQILVYLVAPLAMMGAAVVASLAPALRAARTDAIVALRSF